MSGPSGASVAWFPAMSVGEPGYVDHVNAERNAEAVMAAMTAGQIPVAVKIGGEAAGQVEPRRLYFITGYDKAKKNRKLSIPTEERVFVAAVAFTGQKDSDSVRITRELRVELGRQFSLILAPSIADFYIERRGDYIYKPDW